jgi:hypothetical protein
MRAGHTLNRGLMAAATSTSCIKFVKQSLGAPLCAPEVLRRGQRVTSFQPAGKVLGSGAWLSFQRTAKMSHVYGDTWEPGFHFRNRTAGN